MKLASIELIRNIRPHPNAERLELADILGWQTVVRKGQFKPGDRCVFVVIDTILPHAEWSAFLTDKNSPEKPIRLRTVRLRGQFSQGLALELSVLPGLACDWQVGADVGGLLGIKKYEKEIPANLAGEIAGPFPSFLVSRTDEDNGLSHPEIVEEVIGKNGMLDVRITQKLDGSSCTIIVRGGKIVHVCSRNIDLKESDSNAFWHVAKKLKNLEELGAEFPFVALQGELMGPGIQGNQLKLSEPTLFLFQALCDTGTERSYLDYSDLADLANAIGCHVVPGVNIWHGLDALSLDRLQLLADKQVLPDGSPAEGIVVRPWVSKISGTGRPLSFKIINRNYGE